MRNTDWRIVITRNLLKELKRRGIETRVLKTLRELDRRLDEEPEKVLESLMREPIIFELEEFKVRRLRIGSYRLFYIIDHESCLLYTSPSPRD